MYNREVAGGERLELDSSEKKTENQRLTDLPTLRDGTPWIDTSNGISYTVTLFV